MSTLKFSHALSKRILQDVKTLLLDDFDWQNREPIPDLEQAYKIMSTLYVKYILLANLLTKLINITINYHKREKMKPILSNLFGRIVELKAEITAMKKTDFPYLDNILMELGVSRKELEILIPEYYRMERAFVVKEFFKYTDKIKDGLVLKQFPNKPISELALDLRNYFVTEAQVRKTIEGEREGRRIERLREPEVSYLASKVRLATHDRPPKASQYFGDNSEMRKIVQMMGHKRDKVYAAMRTIVKQPLNELYESWKFPFARDVARAPYFQGEKYFHGYEKLVDPVKYGKFIAAIELLQKHERARTGEIYYMIMKERHEKIFTILMNRRKGLNTVLKSKSDFFYPLKRTTINAPHVATRGSSSHQANELDSTVQLYGLLPQQPRNPDLCEKYRQYKSNMRKAMQQTYEDIIEAETLVELELSRMGELKKLDLIDEILEYFKSWHNESKPLAATVGWDLLDIPNPDKKVLPPPQFVVGIPMALTDDYVGKNFEKLTKVPLLPPPLMGSALIVSGNHITKEQYMAVKPLAAARQAMPKEAKEAEAQKLKEQKEKQKETENKKKGKEVEGYKPHKSPLPGLTFQKSRDWEFTLRYEESELLTMISPKTFADDDIDWQIANQIDAALRGVIDKKMIKFQKSVRTKMIKKHKKAENLKKRKLPGMKKPKKEWHLKDKEKWETVYALAKEGYFRNHRKMILDNTPGTNIFAYANYELIEEYLTEPEPAWGDLYQLVKLWCILPLADLNVRQHGPVASAVGFVGPRDVVSRLVCSVTHETGAVLIHIDPLRPERDIPLKNLAAMIAKMAKSAQPTIILVDNCHLLFKKKEKGVTSEPSPYLKIVSKLKKSINRKFRVLMIAATDKPELVNGARMRKVFDKVIPFPHMDYHTSSDYWAQYLFGNEKLAKNFPYPALLEPTKKYRTKEITQMFSNNPLTAKRTENLSKMPLAISEFVESLQAAQATEATPASLKIKPSGYEWAIATYKTFKARKKMLKELLNERKELLAGGKDKKKGKKDKK